MKPIKWAKCTYILTLIFAVQVMLASLARADSLNVTVCTLALYLLTNTQDVKKKHFRMLVFFLAFSFLYDILWQFFHDGAEGQLEGNSAIISFGKWMQLIMVFYKVILLVVYWKASIDFDKMID